MAKLLHFFIALPAATVLLTVPSLALRDEASSGEGKGLESSIVDWASLARGRGQEGQVAAELVINLETGVSQSISTASFTQTDDALTLEVDHAKVNQGEIATPSKVPVMWTLEHRVKYSLLVRRHQDGLDVWTLEVEGIKLLPFSEGLDMYKRFQASQEANKAACSSNHEELLARVQCERKTLFKWYERMYKAEFKQSTYLKFDPITDHKIGRILIGMYGSTATYYAVGTEGWEKIIYSLVTIPPVQIDAFSLHATSNKYTQVEMGMKTSPVFEGTYGDLNLAEYLGFDFESKNRAEFDKKDFEKQRSKGEVFARSGMNFGAMVAKGHDASVRGGTAEYILRFASPCLPTGKGNTFSEDKYKDPTVKCKDSNGRVYWH